MLHDLATVLQVEAGDIALVGSRGVFTDSSPPQLLVTDEELKKAVSRGAQLDVLVQSRCAPTIRPDFVLPRAQDRPS